MVLWWCMRIDITTNPFNTPCKIPWCSLLSCHRYFIVSMVMHCNDHAGKSNARTPHACWGSFARSHFMQVLIKKRACMHTASTALASFPGRFFSKRTEGRKKGLVRPSVKIEKTRPGNEATCSTLTASNDCYIVSLV